jgi:Cys-tRNA(Pro)/Cys-tRNA(Cys) deacylase
VLALVPVTSELNLKALATLAGAKRAEMAMPQEAERSTGYVVGWH